MPILEVKNIKKNFGKTEVLKGVSFSMEKGDVVAVIGSSGVFSMRHRKKSLPRRSKGHGSLISEWFFSSLICFRSIMRLLM